MNKIYKVMNRDKVVCYIVDKGKIGVMNPVYRIWKCEDGVMVEGDYYYPYIHSDISIYRNNILVPVSGCLDMDINSLNFYLDDAWGKGMKYTHLVEVSEEEIEKMRELCEDNHKDFKE